MAAHDPAAPEAVPGVREQGEEALVQGAEDHDALRAVAVRGRGRGAVQECQDLRACLCDIFSFSFFAFGG